jgi:hypothetical protein
MEAISYAEAMTPTGCEEIILDRLTKVINDNLKTYNGEECIISVKKLKEFSGVTIFNDRVITQLYKRYIKKFWVITVKRIDGQQVLSIESLYNIRHEK